MLPSSFYPTPPGGTEVYVEALALELAARGHAVTILAPWEGNGRDEEAWHGPLRVVRFGLPPRRPTLDELYGIRCPEIGERFGRWLDRARPDVVHFHTLTRGCSLDQLREASRRRIGTALTYHTPSITCLRAGTLQKWGRTPCDGTLDPRPCGSCLLHSRGIPRPLSDLIAALPPGLGGRLARLTPGRMATAIQVRRLAALLRAAWDEAVDRVDRVVAPCDWVWDLLLRNGVPAAKLTRSRQGLCFRAADDSPGETRERAGMEPRATDRGSGDSSPALLRVGFLGRFDPVKGLHVLTDAIGRLGPDVPIELTIYGVSPESANRAYAERVRARVAGDRRIRIEPAVPPARVPHVLGSLDVLAVPSVWMETGPLVVLEAQAAGVVVLGSDLGGIPELVHRDRDGWLVPPGAVDSWARALERLAREPQTVRRLRAGIGPVRTTRDVADDMEAMYHQMVVGHSPVAKGQ